MKKSKKVVGKAHSFFRKSFVCWWCRCLTASAKIHEKGEIDVNNHHFLCRLSAYLLAACLLAGCASAPSQTLEAEPPAGTEQTAGTQQATAAQTEPATAAQTEAETQQEAETAGQADGEEPYPGYSVIEGMYEAMDERAREYAPQITTLDSGVQIQRTPTEYDAGVYHTPGNSISYNTYYLKADERGCAACHPDMNATLNNMEYPHADLSGSFGIQTTVSQCLDCHSYSPGYVTEFYGFGTLIHSIHDTEQFTGSCQSCHNMTGDGEGIQLWDEVKHQVLRGITDVADPAELNAEFSYSQDVTVAADDVFYFNWMYYDYDYVRYAADEADIEPDPEQFDTWTISVSGEVDNPVKMTLPELIEIAPTVERMLTMQCTVNPVGGPYIANVNIKGIPLTWLLEYAGVHSDATVVLPIAIDGFVEPVHLDYLAEHEAYLVYEIDGKRLSMANGYPVQLWPGGCGAGEFVKQLTDLVVEDDDADNYYMYMGWETEDGEGYYNKPNVGIFYTQEGQIIEAGKPYTFEGYAHGFDWDITSIEFSLDRGATWTGYDVSDNDSDQWICWNYTITPPETPGAYVLMVRAVAENGSVTDAPVEIMVNVK